MAPPAPPLNPRLVKYLFLTDIRVVVTGVSCGISLPVSFHFILILTFLSMVIHSVNTLFYREPCKNKT